MRAVKFALRTLFRTPFVTSVAILSLGLGIGANTAIFSLFNQLLLRPLPVPAPGELVNLGAPGIKNGSTSCGLAGNCDVVFSYPMFRDLEREQKALTGIAAHRLFSANIGYRQQTIAEDAVAVSGSYFNVLGLQPVVGRLITSADDQAVGESPVAVLSYDYWQRRFNGDPAIVGDALVVNGQSLQVIGVVASGFDGTTAGVRPKVYVPITLRTKLEAPFNGYADRDNYWAYLFGRLKPGVTIEQAKASLDGPYRSIVTQVELPQQTGLSDADKARYAAKEIAVEDGRRGQSRVYEGTRTSLMLLLAVTTVVLLIACANIANLLLVRGAGRGAEMAVRLSIGASRGQLIRQLLLESCLLALMGGVAGLLFSRLTMAFILAMLSTSAANTVAFQMNWVVLAFSAGLSVLTGLLFGIFPAIHSTRPDLTSTLKSQAGQPSGAKTVQRFRASLATIQIALSMGLLTSAGLFAKSLVNVSRVDLGVEIDQVVTFRINPRRNGYTPERALALLEQAEEELRRQPGVRSAAAARVPLLADSNSSQTITVEGFTPAPGGNSNSNVNEVSPGYFQTIGVPLLAGRDFTEADRQGAPLVAIVNEAFTRKFNLGQNPVGRRMRRGGTRPGSPAQPLNVEIVGLARDAKYSSVRADVPPVFFTPYRQSTQNNALAFYALISTPTEDFLPSISTLMRRLDPNLPVDALRTMLQQVRENVAGDRFVSVLSASFAGLATLLAAIGLYGVLAYTVAQRTREFGLRMALGAPPSRVRSLVLRQVMWMTVIGGVIGLTAAIWLVRLSASLLFRMESYDPFVLSASTIALTLVALGAGLVPALRASRIDPMTALRYE
ncbi:MAG TPA: ABC transporter permease [Vicinamibacterales bacterium]|nr:ABC transporter permease [Vicinamibacterales bacterium]